MCWHWSQVFTSFWKKVVTSDTKLSSLTKTTSNLNTHMPAEKENTLLLLSVDVFILGLKMYRYEMWLVGAHTQSRLSHTHIEYKVSPHPAVKPWLQHLMGFPTQLLGPYEPKKSRSLITYHLSVLAPLHHWGLAMDWTVLASTFSSML